MVRVILVRFLCSIACCTVLTLNVHNLAAQETSLLPDSARENEIYEGDLRNGLRDGFGKLTLADGSIYEGGFENDVPSDADATLTFSDGRVYRGTFINGQIQGYGTLEWPSGDVYNGTFNSNSITGSGTFFFASGNVTYTGTVQDGLRHGLGIMLWPDGRRYDGAFRLNHRHGFGVYQTADGATFRGFFEADARHGDGVFADRQGVKQFQRWNQGELVTSMPLEPVERCKLEINGQPWMFEQDECINGFANGTGLAVRLDGLAYINTGRFVVGHLVDGVIISLTNEASE